MGKPTDITGNEKHVKGRQAGVADTYGTSRKGVAEKTIHPAHDANDGGGEDGLKGAASSIYKKAVKNGGGEDRLGDCALHDR